MLLNKSINTCAVVLLSNTLILEFPGMHEYSPLLFLNTYFCSFWLFTGECGCLWVCGHACKMPTAVQGVGASGSGVTNNCKLLLMVSGTQTQVLCRSSKCYSPLGHPPAQGISPWPGTLISLRTYLFKTKLFNENFMHVLFSNLWPLL